MNSDKLTLGEWIFITPFIVIITAIVIDATWQWSSERWLWIAFHFTQGYLTWTIWENRHNLRRTRMMKLSRTDPFTGKSNSMTLDITADDLQRWRDGALIQDVFPNLTSDEREFIMTGITPESWEEAFGTDEVKKGDS
jgi:hypothetical protein